MLILLAPLLWPLPARAWTLSLPAGEDPAAWAPVVEEAGGALCEVSPCEGGVGDAELRLRSEPWRLEVDDRVVAVAPPRNAAERADLVFLALSLRAGVATPAWGEVPAAPPAAHTRPSRPAPHRSTAPALPSPAPAPAPLPAPLPSPEPAAPPPPRPAPAPAPSPLPVALPEPQPAPPPPAATPPRVGLALAASLLGDPGLASAAHLRAGLALDPAPWARLELAALVTTRRAHDADRTQEEAGVGMRLLHRGGPLAVGLGLDLRARSFREAEALVERGLVPVGEVGLAWTLPGTPTALGLDLGRDLRRVAFFEGEEALGTLPPWTLRLGLGLVVPLQARVEGDKGDRAPEVVAP